MDIKTFYKKIILSNYSLFVFSPDFEHYIGERPLNEVLIIIKDYKKGKINFLNGMSEEPILVLENIDFDNAIEVESLKDISLFFEPYNKLNFSSYYKMFNKQDFIKKCSQYYLKFDRKKFTDEKGVEWSYNDTYGQWRFDEIYGLFFKNREYSKKCSDFGSDHIRTVITGDSKYFKLGEKEPVDISWDPQNNYHSNLFESTFYGGYDSDSKKHRDPTDLFLEKVFAHFYENKEYVFENFDNIEWWNGRSKWFQEPYGGSLEDKPIPLPKFLLDKIFILTKQYCPRCVEIV